MWNRIPLVIKRVINRYKHNTIMPTTTSNKRITKKETSQPPSPDNLIT